MNNSNDRQCLQYIETLRQASQPVKIDTLLLQRMNAFVKARKVNINKIKHERSSR